LIPEKTIVVTLVSKQSTPWFVTKVIKHILVWSRTVARKFSVGGLCSSVGRLCVCRFVYSFTASTIQDHWNCHWLGAGP